MDAPEQRVLNTVSRRHSAHLILADQLKSGAHSSRETSPWQHSADMSDFIESIEVKLHSLWEESDPKRLALKISYLIGEIIRRETGVRHGAEGLENFFSITWATPIIRRLIGELLASAQVVASHRASVAVESAFQKEHVLTQLSTVLHWYAVRRCSLLAIQRGDIERETEALFNLEIHHDREFLGHRGMEVMAGCSLVGRLGERLWFKATVRNEKGQVAAKANWLQWTDRTDSQLIGLPEQGENTFASIVPLVPDAQRIIIDTVRAFIPYEALDLAAGRHNLVVEVGIFTDSGRKILSDTSSCCVSLAPNRSAFEADEEIPSPHCTEVWPVNAVSGESITVRRISQELSETGGWEQDVIAVGFDLNLVGREGQDITIECRFLTSDGDLVGARNISNAEGHLGYLQRFVLRPQEPFSHYYDLKLLTPLSALELEIGKYDIFSELSVLGPDGELICGAFGRTVINVSEFVEGYVPVRNLFVAGLTGPQESFLRLSLLDVDPLWSLGGADSLRICSVFTSDDWSAHTFRIVHSLEGVEGGLLHGSGTERIPLQKVIRVGGAEGSGEEMTISNFPLSECLPQNLASQNGRISLRARVRGYSADGRVLVDAERDVIVRPPRSAAGSELFEAPVGEVWMSDVFNRFEKDRKHVSVCVAVSFYFNGFKPPPYVIYYELVSTHKEKKALAELDSFEEFLPGRTISSEDRTWDGTRRALGWYQELRQLDWELPSRRKFLRNDDVFMKIMLLSPAGKLLQVLYHPLYVGGRICLQPRKPATARIPRVEVRSPERPSIAKRVGGWFSRGEFR